MSLNNPGYKTLEAVQVLCNTFDPLSDPPPHLPTPLSFKIIPVPNFLRTLSNNIRKAIVQKNKIVLITLYMI